MIALTIEVRNAQKQTVDVGIANAPTQKVNVGQNTIIVPVHKDIAIFETGLVIPSGDTIVNVGFNELTNWGGVYRELPQIGDYVFDSNGDLFVVIDVSATCTTMRINREIEFATDEEATEILGSIYGETSEDIPDIPEIDIPTIDRDFATDKEVDDMLDDIFGNIH